MKARILKPLSMQVGSDIHNPSGGRLIQLPVGGVVSIEDSRSMSCNVWVTWQGERGKIECGEIRNLTANGRVELI
jgi:hypothetical protein